MIDQQRPAQTLPPMLTDARRAKFLARVASFADYLALARDRCGDDRLAWRINEAIRPLDELLMPPRELAAQAGLSYQPRYRPHRRDGPLDGKPFKGDALDA